MASLEETQGLLSRFDRVYSGYRYILKGAQGVLWWVAMSLRARCFFFHTHFAESKRFPCIGLSAVYFFSNAGNFFSIVGLVLADDFAPSAATVLPVASLLSFA